MNASQIPQKSFSSMYDLLFRKNSGEHIHSTGQTSFYLPAELLLCEMRLLDYQDSFNFDEFTVILQTAAPFRDCNLGE